MRLDSHRRGGEVFSFLITEQQLIEIYHQAVGALLEEAKPPLAEVLAQIVARPDATSSGLPLYPTFFAKVAALFQAIAHEKPFPEGNRKVAWECARYLLETRGYRLSATDQEMEQVMAGAELGFTSVNRIALWFKGHARREG